ncbi:MAG: SDR family oxidoreductase [SAR202 cluster bacterium]|nr:SDR family oxidoreductase [SAR202 cluster bacterium]
MTRKRLMGKVALITGGARGIGAAQGRLFAEHGAVVVLADVLEEQGALAADHINASDGQACFVKLDVSREKDWEAAVDTIMRSYGKLNILVNNAGIYSIDPVIKTRVTEWDRIMRVNVLGAFLGAKHAIPAMQKTGSGVIVFVASTTAHVANARGGAYGASKAALLSLTRHTAVQHARDNIRANVIVPGPVETDMIAGNIATPEGRAASIARVPLGRLGTVEELAHAALFLASDDSTYMTGAELVVDGGLTAQ